MTNNDILRRVRYIFDYSDAQMIGICALADLQVEEDEMKAWLKPEDEETEIKDIELALFLNGLIVEKRGPSDKGIPVPEDTLNNNIIFRKIKIAMDMKNEDVLDVFELMDVEVSPHEITAFLRAPKQKQYRDMQDQFLRNFMNGLQKKLRPSEATESNDNPFDKVIKKD